MVRDYYILVFLCFTVSLSFASAVNVGINSDIGINLIPEVPVNYSTLYVNDSFYWQGYTPTTIPGNEFWYNQTTGAINYADATFLPLAGGTMSGNILMDGNTINFEAGGSITNLFSLEIVGGGITTDGSAVVTSDTEWDFANGGIGIEASYLSSHVGDLLLDMDNQGYFSATNEWDLKRVYISELLDISANEGGNATFYNGKFDNNLSVTGTTLTGQLISNSTDWSKFNRGITIYHEIGGGADPFINIGYDGGYATIEGYSSLRVGTNTANSYTYMTNDVDRWKIHATTGALSSLGISPIEMNSNKVYLTNATNDANSYIQKSGSDIYIRNGGDGNTYIYSWNGAANKWATFNAGANGMDLSGIGMLDVNDSAVIKGNASGVIHLYQGADNQGLRIWGYDDVVGSNSQWYINSAGNTLFQSTGSFQIGNTQGASRAIIIWPDKYLYMDLTTAGDEIRVRDGAYDTVLAIDNSGTLTNPKTDMITINDNLNVTGNINVTGCIEYNNGGARALLGTCV